MQTHFKGTHYELTPETTAYAEKRLDSLTKFLGAHKETAQVYVDLGKESNAHQHGRIWYAEMNLDANGERFHARAVEENLDTAIDTVVAELARVLHTHRDRKMSLMKRGGAMLKRLMQRGQDD